MRELIRSLKYALRRWNSTVFVETNSACAISRFVSPRSASSATRRSLGVSASVPRTAGRRGRAPAATSSAARVAGEPARAGVVGDVEAQAQRLARRRALAVGMLRGAEVDERARQLQLSGRALQRCDRLLQQREPVGALRHEPGGA